LPGFECSVVVTILAGLNVTVQEALSHR
jgi:hypothetical protein